MSKQGCYIGTKNWLIGCVKFMCWPSNPGTGQTGSCSNNQSGIESDVFVRSAIVDMYAKCGNLDDARLSFDKIYKPDTVLWTTIISAYAQHGHGREALLLFEEMQQAGLTPNHVTFLGVLAACSHTGLVDKGWHYFLSMSQHHGIRPRVEHYVCMVDILGRSGHLDEAEDLINSIPYEPDAILWKALLGACRVHGNLDIGRRAAEHLFDLEPQNAASYVLLSNVYAAAGKWDDVAKVRRMMKDREVKKNPGCSWIEIKNVVHKFIVGDRSHPQSERIYAMLNHLSKRMKEAGYMPDMLSALKAGKSLAKVQLMRHHLKQRTIHYPASGVRIPILDLSLGLQERKPCSFLVSAIILVWRVIDSTRVHHLIFLLRLLSWLKVVLLPFLL